MEDERPTLTIEETAKRLGIGETPGTGTNCQLKELECQSPGWAKLGAEGEGLQRYLFAILLRNPMHAWHPFGEFPKREVECA